jgi:hypothetical protein
MDGLGRDEDLSCLDCRRLLAVDLILERPFEDVDDLFARMLVPDGRRVGGDVDAVLDDLASRSAEIVLEIGASEARDLLGCGLSGARGGPPSCG